MKKKKISNIVMVMLVLVMVVGAVFVVGSLKSSSTEGKLGLVARDKIGNVTINRNDIIYNLDDETAIVGEDTLETKNGSSVSLIKDQNNYVSLNKNSNLTVRDKGNNFYFELGGGEVFSSLEKKSSFVVGGTMMECEKGTYFFTANVGANSVFVLDGEVAFSGETVTKGSSITVLGSGESEEVLKEEFTIGSLNDFIISCIKNSSDEADLIYSKDEVAKLLIERELEKQNASQVIIENEDGTIKLVTGEEAKKIISGETGRSLCTIEIRCDSILDNLADLKDGKDRFVPSDGVVLATTAVSFKEGESAFDVLKRCTKVMNIQFEYTAGGEYGGQYIQGINNLYEKECGGESGWMFKVNGWFPNYGVSSYKLLKGDSILIVYTCKGLGTDIGAKM